MGGVIGMHLRQSRQLASGDWVACTKGVEMICFWDTIRLRPIHAESSGPERGMFPPQFGSQSGYLQECTCVGKGYLRLPKPKAAEKWSAHPLGDRRRSAFIEGPAARFGSKAKD